MKGYGQFCSIAKALEIVGERWTPLIIRELICGSSRFNEIHRGVPRISPSLLSKRLSGLEQTGIIKRVKETGGYELTSSGWELKPLIEALGVWGHRWVRGQLSDDDLDPDLLMWDMRRRINLAAFPDTQICVCFVFTDVRPRKSHYWLVGSSQGVELCISDPSLDVDLFVVTDLRTMTSVWNGDLALAKKVQDGSIDLHGPRPLQQKFGSWLQLNMFASVEPAKFHTRGAVEHS